MKSKAEQLDNKIHRTKLQTVSPDVHTRIVYGIKQIPTPDNIKGGHSVYYEINTGKGEIIFSLHHSGTSRFDFPETTDTIQFKVLQLKDKYYIRKNTLKIKKKGVKKIKL